MHKVTGRREGLEHILWVCLLVLVVLLSNAKFIFSLGNEGQAESGTEESQGGESVQYAMDLTESAQMEVLSKDGMRYHAMELLDGRYTTKLDIVGNAEIKIESQEKISGIYIIWDQPPAFWALQAKEETRTSLYLYGKKGFIHEYIELKNPSTSISILTPRSGAKICEVQIFSDGILPSSVQTWDEPYQEVIEKLLCISRLVP